MKIHIFQSSLLIILSIGGTFSKEGTKNNSKEDDRPKVDLFGKLSLNKFQALLYTELDHEIHSIESNSRGYNRRRKSVYDRIKSDDVLEEANDLWKYLIQHGWFLYENVFPFQSRRNLDSSTIPDAVPEKEKYPFLVCSHSSLLSSASQRLEILGQIINQTLDNENLIVVKNKIEETCILISMDIHIANDLAFSETYVFDFSIIPFTDMMKIGSQTLNDIEFSEWTLKLPHFRKMEQKETGMIHSNNSNDHRASDTSSLTRETNLTIEKSEENYTVPSGIKAQEYSVNETFLNEMPDSTAINSNCERRLSVQVGISQKNQNRQKEGCSSIQEIAKSILDNIQEMGQNGYSRRRQRNLSENESSNFRNMKTMTDHAKNVNEEYILSVRDTFSLTSSYIEINSSDDIQKRRRINALNNSRVEKWGRALEEGIESEHGCRAMFEALKIDRTDDISDTFDIILNPDCSDDGYVTNLIENTKTTLQDTAYNSACVTSLVMGLSVHKDILHVEAEMPIHLTDSTTSSITESGVIGNQPFRSVGLTGANQIINIQDTGVDISVDRLHVSENQRESIHKRWNYEQKVSKYDYGSSGNFEDNGNHGTLVAEVCCGDSLDNISNGGIAPGTKLHVWDLSKSNTIAEPNIIQLLRSMNAWSKNSNQGAKITNASWGSSYRPYTQRCSIYDLILASYLPEITFIAAAGNNGNRHSSEHNAHGNVNDPGSCKNTLTVGSTSTYVNEDIDWSDHLSSYSSKGPTFDGRKKPDLLAVGTVNVGGRWRQGTSYSAPVVSGAAAIVRQYFEEGWYPCGDNKNCDRAQKFQPSGSLVKAILMNGAKPITKATGSSGKDDLKPYDFKQNVGRMNLLSSLPLSSANNHINLVVINNRKLLTSGSIDTFTIQVDHSHCPSSIPLSITMTYYDRRGTAGCTQCLVQDLDLKLQKLDSSYQDVGAQIYATSNQNQPDSINNYEKIVVNTKHLELYAISITATNVVGPQRYSLAATGCFDLKLDVVPSSNSADTITDLFCNP